MILFKTFCLFCFLFDLNQAAVSDENIVLILTFDGFRWDFLTKFKTETPTFQWIIENGISAKWMESVFPTKTYPTQTSIATGLYPENHGIVGNEFYDSGLKKEFGTKTKYNGEFYQRGQPIWVTTRANKIKSCVAAWQGRHTEHAVGKEKHGASYTFNNPNARNKCMDVLKKGTRLVASWYDNPDDKAHYNLLDSEKFIKALKSADKELKEIIDELKKQKRFNRTNIIIVADHGMEKIILPEGLVSLKDAKDSLDISLIKRVESHGTVFSFELKDKLDKSTKEEFLTNLTNFLGNKFTVYKSREEIPERFHYRNAKNRIPNYNVFAKPGYKLFKGKPPGDEKKLKNDHGYDNELPNMKPIFLAYGPDFKNMPRKVKEVHQVDIYGLALKLLKLDHLSPKNGSISRINNIINGD